jgi:hypothetical protein
MAGEAFDLASAVLMMTGVVARTGESGSLARVLAAVLRPTISCTRRLIEKKKLMAMVRSVYSSGRRSQRMMQQSISRIQLRTMASIVWVESSRILVMTPIWAELEADRAELELEPYRAELEHQPLRREPLAGDDDEGELEPRAVKAQ